MQGRRDFGTAGHRDGGSEGTERQGIWSREQSSEQWTVDRDRYAVAAGRGYLLVDRRLEHHGTIVRLKG